MDQFLFHNPLISISPYIHSFSIFLFRPRICCEGSSLLVALDMDMYLLKRVCMGRTSYFCYLLIDPTRFPKLSFRHFVSSIFYVGKGTGPRPFHHLIEAHKCRKNANKVKKIDKISLYINISAPKTWNWNAFLIYGTAVMEWFYCTFFTIFIQPRLLYGKVPWSMQLVVLLNKFN
jgi:hypothetical protein